MRSWAEPCTSQPGAGILSRCNIKTLPHYRQIEAAFDFHFKKLLWLSIRLVFLKRFRDRITCGSCWNADPTSVSLDWRLRLCTSSNTTGSHLEYHRCEKYIVLREKKAVRRCFSNFNISYFMKLYSYSVLYSLKFSNLILFWLF